MGLEALQDNISFLAEQTGPEELVLPLSSGDDGEFWQEIVNLRLRQKGIYTRWEPRGGTSLLHQSLSEIDGSKVRTLEAFRAAYGGVQYRFLIIHTAIGAAYFYDLDTNTLKTIVAGFGGSVSAFGSSPIYVVQQGKLVYLFDPQTQHNRVYDFINDHLYDWMGAPGGEIYGASWVSSDPKKPFPEQNVFGLKAGAGVIAIPAKAELYPSDGYMSQSRAPVYFATTSAFWIYFQYDSDRETLIRSDGQEIKATGYYYIPPGVGLAATSDKSSSLTVPPEQAARAKYLRARPGQSGWPVALPGEDPNELFRIRQGVIASEIDPERTQADPNFISYETDVLPAPPSPEEYVLGGYFTSDGRFKIIQFLGGSWDESMLLTPNTLPNIGIRVMGAEWRPYDYFDLNDESESLTTILVPDRRDLREVLEYTPMIEAKSGGVIEEKTDFKMPVLQRAYSLINVLEDGSYTLPGPPLVISLSADKIIKEGYFSVRLDIPGAPGGVASRQLIATRWHLSEEQMFTPTSEHYPNGRWFLHSEIGSEADDSFIDNKADEDLLTELGNLLPLAAGVHTQFASGELRPQTISQYKGSLFLGGYDINRQAPESDKNLVLYDGGSPDTNTDILVYYEYSNGDTSDMIHVGQGGISSGNGPPYMRFFGLNALIKKVTVLARSNSNYYQIARFDSKSPLFHGARIPLPVDGNTSGLGQLFPSVSGQQTRSLHDHFLVAIPFQQAQIDQQVSLAKPAIIRSMIPLSFDQDKSLMRFRALIQTDKDLQVGYITEQSVGESTLVRGEFETVFVGMGTQDGRGARRIGELVYVSGERGLYAIPVSMDGQIGRRQLIIDAHRYPEAASPLQWITHNETDDEVWFVFPGSNNVFVWSLAHQVRRYIFSSESGPLAWIDGKVLGAIENKIVEHEASAYGTDHNGVSINTWAESRHLLTPQHQVRLLTLGVTGRGVQVQPDLDLQPARRRGSGQPWSPEFTEDLILTGKNAEMWERLWDLRRQAITPRIRLNFSFSEGGEVHGIRLRYVPLRNTGKPNNMIGTE